MKYFNGSFSFNGSTTQEITKETTQEKELTSIRSSLYKAVNG